MREIYYRRVRSYCGAEIKEFAECCKGRTLSLAWACRPQQLAMNTCMIARAKPEEEDRAREEWFAGLDERRRKREEELRAVEERRREIILLTEEKKRQEDEERRRRLR